MSVSVGAVKVAMTRQSVGLRELARRTHYDVAYISRALRGLQRPSETLMRALADALNLSDDDDRVAYAARNPGRIDAAGVQALAASLAAQRRADDVVGPGPLVNAAEAQREALTALLRKTSGKHRKSLAAVASQASQFAGWLRIELSDYPRASALLNEAIDLADEIEDGSLAAQAHNLRGNIARQRQQWSAVHRNFVAAYASESAPRQRVVNGAQAAWALAMLDRRSEAEQLLSEVEALRDKAADCAPPATAYWLTPEWMSLPIGHAHLLLGRHRDAAEHLRTGLYSLPLELRYALWTSEARAALAEAEV
ncbi:helix-turn-helix domain-containing protein [Streptomyces phytophilus]|uniref:helix-turn-helix domain-containing protein n=1 Tax=Streptomyces phytophilus TaxID=722715 RepID=UPI0015F05EB4|nr:helix-turn-helix transcriptional regulator [Streptomyces phytophilus]